MKKETMRVKGKRRKPRVPPEGQERLHQGEAHQDKKKQKKKQRREKNRAKDEGNVRDDDPDVFLLHFSYFNKRQKRCRNAICCS